MVSIAWLLSPWTKRKALQHVKSRSEMMPLETVPDDILANILIRLGLGDIQNIARCSKALRSATISIQSTQWFAFQHLRILIGGIKEELVEYVKTGTESERDPETPDEDYFMPAWHFYFWRRVGELKFAALPVSYTAALLRLAGLNRRSLSACGVKTQRTSNILLIEWRKDSFARNKAHIEKALLQLVAEKESFRNWIETECDHSLLLVWACAAGSIDIVYFIQENHWKETQEAHTLAMVTSAGCGHINILQYLIENCGIDPSASNNEALEWAAKSGHLEVVEYLLADERTDPSAVSSMPLMWACKFGHLAVVDRLLKDGRSDPSAQEHSGLLSAARAGYTHIVKLLLQDERVNVNAQNAHALLYSTCHGHAETLNVLLKAGADASLQNYLPFHIAVQTGNARAVQIFIGNSQTSLIGIWMRLCVLVFAPVRKIGLSRWLSMLTS